ncbi:cell division protein ZapA [Myroides sp. JBRI-B21084]|uniref:cell division protein ZapA n=1 Tax=Myroides sp. JBRI-B21084 TaxID=3119977 RepID=UPI0026E3674D|nr:cell division protein ZapA [Paenimyroides cloacae]WKW46591.1 cell division protein ZapA [Paenimyroides cloacae]
MEEKIKIRVSIADRVYPLTVNSDQEEGIRAAVKKIEAMTLQLEENFAMRDKQDVLAFCALQFASQVEQNRIQNEEGLDNSKEKLVEFNKSLDTILLKYHIK